MKLKPIKFIGHKLGPFEHIELNWDRDSRYTLIVGENGMGKTTLVTAMAACLSFGDDTFFPPSQFDRFAHSEESFAALEVEWKGKTERLLRWTLKEQAPNKTREEVELFLGLHNSGQIKTEGYSASWSSDLIPVLRSWRAIKEIEVLTAAYGVNRDIQQPKIQEYRELNQKLLEDILDPFAPIQSNELFQWIANQYINHALALSENKPDEAQAYLAAIQRVEALFSEGLEYPVSFQLKRNPFRLEVAQNGSTLSVEQLSDGTRSFLSWSLDYLMRASRVNWLNPIDSALAPGLILVDEIDLHLHPEWQRRIMSVVSRLLPETYVIATTHSPFVIGATDEAQIFQIYRDQGGQLAVKASFDELYGYPADLVLEKTFVPSLYAPEIEQKLLRLSELAGKVASGNISPTEKQEHDELLKQLAEKNPWLNSLLALSQTQEP
jgi:predicted ATP-binding protein involved in virulence